MPKKDIENPEIEDETTLEEGRCAVVDSINVP